MKPAFDSGRAGLWHGSSWLSANRPCLSALELSFPGRWPHALVRRRDQALAACFASGGDEVVGDGVVAVGCGQ